VRTGRLDEAIEAYGAVVMTHGEQLRLSAQGDPSWGLQRRENPRARWARGVASIRLSELLRARGRQNEARDALEDARLDFTGALRWLKDEMTLQQLMEHVDRLLDPDATS